MKRYSFVSIAFALVIATSISLNANINRSQANANINGLTHRATPATNNALFGITAHLNAPGAKKSLEKAKKNWLNNEKLNRRKAHTNSQKQNDKQPQQTLFDTIHIGYGGASAYDFYSQDGSQTIWMSTIDLALDSDIGANSYYQDIKDFDPDDFNQLQQHLTNSKYIIYWLPQNWSEDWFSISQIQLAMDEGYVPVFIYWYFGDHLVDGLPTQTEIDAYYENNTKVSDFLAQLDGEKMIIMEPEFNKNAIVATEQTQQSFASIISLAIDNIKPNNPTMLVSLCMTDAGNRSETNTQPSCGYENCALGDTYSWSKPHSIYTQLLDKIDFISFQQMVAQFSRDPQNPGSWSNPNPKAYTNEEVGIELLAERINNLTTFLHQTYNKPIFLPYITVATATWEDKNSNDTIDMDEVDLEGWEEQASIAYANLSNLKEELHSNGLFGYAPMALFDHPSHDEGGYQYFLNNEYHLGITKTSAQDEIDTHLLGDITFKSDILSNLYQ